LAFIIRKYHEARSSECQMRELCFETQLSVLHVVMYSDSERKMFMNKFP